MFECVTGLRRRARITLGNSRRTTAVYAVSHRLLEQPSANRNTRGCVRKPAYMAMGVFRGKMLPQARLLERSVACCQHSRISDRHMMKEFVVYKTDRALSRRNECVTCRVSDADWPTSAIKPIATKCSRCSLRQHRGNASSFAERRFSACRPVLRGAKQHCNVPSRTS